MTDYSRLVGIPTVSTGLIERHLAAIVAADVVGYSRLMGANEKGTLAALKAHRLALIDPLIAAHKGHIVKTTGDGLLLSFPSIVEAVSCAVAMQSGMARRNKNIAADVRIEFRIGVNLGDVIVEKGDVFGDGVNIAARLEQIAPPGGICLSEDAYRQVRGKLEIPIADAGEQNLKNISNPIKVYRIEPSVAAAVEPEAPLAQSKTTIVGVGMGGGGDNGRDRFGGDHMVQFASRATRCIAECRAGKADRVHRDPDHCRAALCQSNRRRKPGIFRRRRNRGSYQCSRPFQHVAGDRTKCRAAL